MAMVQELSLSASESASPVDRSEQARIAANARKTHANQYTTGKRDRASDASRDVCRAEFAAKKLEQHMKNPKLRPLSSTQVAAAKILMDKGKPSLQAVEQTNIDAAATLSESEIKDSLRQLIAANPDLLQELLAEHAKANTPQLHSIPDPTTQAPESKDNS